MEINTATINKYIDLLKEYNQQVNIYSKKAYHHLDFHIQDSINIAKYVSELGALKVIDLGSGSGLPSAINAIINPKIHCIALESKEKKRTFLFHVKHHLNLTNYEIFEGDIQRFASLKNSHSDCYTAKAFAPIDKVIKTVKKLTKKPTKVIVPISHHQYTELPDALQKFCERRTVNNNNFIYLIKDLNSSPD